MENPTRDFADIPLSVVKLNRWILVVGVLAGLVLQQPLITTALFLILLPGIFFGRRANLIFRVGQCLSARQIAVTEYEDQRLMRFNNAISAIILGLAQVAFLTGHPMAGWVFAMVLAAAAAAAITGFCVGCFLYYQFKLNRYRLFGS